MVEIDSLRSRISNFQKTILNDLKPYIIDEKDLLNSNNWFNDASDILIFNQKQKLIISSQSKKTNYLSYMEKNNSFDYLPLNETLIIPNEKFEFEFKGDELGKISAHAVIIEYSLENKINVHKVKLNQKYQFITSENTRKIRIALRVKGEGLLSLEGFSAERTRNLESHNTVIPIKNKKNVQNIKELVDLKIACIFDEFSMTSFSKQADLITFTPENWLEKLTEEVPDALIVESAWKGNFGSWEYKIAKYNNQDQSALIALIEWCKSNGIPTAFWNKEDPIHFEKFIHTAKLFDFIFTTDANMIPKYQQVTGNEKVYAMPFSAEPSIHNPIKITNQRINKVSFAGSYYANRHADRKKDMDELLDIAAEYGLDIFDRNYERNMKEKTDFSFPNKFESNIKGSLKYDEIDIAYKGYKVMLNVNSVKNSPTMFSRRVFEGLACGTPIISSYSEGIKKTFKDIVLISENKDELKQNLNKLKNDTKYYDSKSLQGIREIFKRHTYKHRIAFMFNKFGIDINIKPKEVTIVSIANSKKEFEQILEIFNSQTWNSKKLVVLLDTFEGYVDILNNYNNSTIKTFVLSYTKSHYSRLKEIIDTEHVGFIDINNFYGENYLLDLMLGFEYSNADIIGKGNFYQIKKDNLIENRPNCEYEYVNNLCMDSSVMKVEVFAGQELQLLLQNISNMNLEDYFKKGSRLLSIDKYNFVKKINKYSNKKNQWTDIEL